MIFRKAWDTSHLMIQRKNIDTHLRVNCLPFVFSDLITDLRVVFWKNPNSQDSAQRPTTYKDRSLTATDCFSRNRYRIFTGNLPSQQFENMRVFLRSNLKIWRFEDLKLTNIGFLGPKNHGAGYCTVIFTKYFFLEICTI